MKWIFFISGLFVLSTGWAQKKLSLSSPGKNISFSFRITKESPLYSVSFKENPIIVNSEIGLDFMETGEFKSNLVAGQPQYRKGEEKYELIVGKTRFVHHYYNELLIPLKEKAGHFRRINFVIRAFDDGLAFRYEFPVQKNRESISLTEENTCFNFNDDPKVLGLFLPNYTTSHEGEYSSFRLSEIKEDTLIDMPAFFEFSKGIYVAITEAALVNYAGMYLSKHHAVLTSRLSPLPAQQNIKVIMTLPHKTPWRVILINDRIGGLIESNILTSLNEPCKIKDLSWIKPGKSTFPWWNGNVVPDTLNAPGNNFVTNQYYIDFCARNGIEYHSVVEYGLHQWYVDDGVNFQPGPNADVTRPVPGFRPPGVFAGLLSENIIKVHSRRDPGLFNLPNFAYMKNLIITHFAFFIKTST